MRINSCLAALAMVSVTTAAMADDKPFSADAAATWSARSRLMAGVLDEGKDSKAAYAAACEGLRGEVIKHEYNQAPKWAVMAQVDVCLGYGSVSGKFGATSKPCIFFIEANKQLEHASDPGTPAEVVSAAAALRTTMDAHIQVAMGYGKNRCKK